MTKNNKTLKAVIYARDSKGLNIDVTIDTQVSEIKKYARENNIEIIHEYIETSNTCKINERKQFQKMICDSERKEFNLILVYRFDRLSRLKNENLFYKIALRRNGVKVISVTQPITDAPEETFLENLHEVFNEYADFQEAQRNIKNRSLNQGGNLYNE